MIYLYAQPAIAYYAWQLEVSIQSLLSNHVGPEQIHVVSGMTKGHIAPGFHALQNKYPEIVWRFYHDNRTSEEREYKPLVRPHILKKHWRRHPELEQEAVFYMEADTILTRPIPEYKFTQDEVWYMSNTVSYIGHEYITQSDPRFLELFCGIVGVDAETVKNNQDNSGGAQYIMKNLTEQYWTKVEKDTQQIWKQGQKLLKQIKEEKPEWHPLQIWTSCMWGHLWNAWYFGHETKVHSDLDFTWATDPREYIEKNRIYHNAGVTEKHTDLMMKSDYFDTLPYGEKKEINQDKAGAYYWAKIQETGKQTVLK